ncbi:glucose-6-phosphate isomerase [Candidatus Pelagibacter communis]|uniref:glucose-6-phosphate isomerase n=1 Tax=Pelagibacter ubique TaxID=198252 RepID=UPI00065B4233|nr:glucose-6-phosphate isomerase [Candidatus Pelagibacter ubique]
MLTKNIKLKPFGKKKLNKNLKKKLINLLNEENFVIKSLKKEYKNNFNKNTISKFKTFSNYRVIGMGGSSLGTQAIYDFLEHKIKKKFEFLDNLKSLTKKNKKKRYLNLIISKSGNTTETIVNTNIFVKKKNKNIFITENKKNYLHTLAEKFKSEIIHHNNFIGGRYSVLSEVGMLPAELMDLDSRRFKQLNNLIKNKNYLNSLVNNVDQILYFTKRKKFNSIIINYDEKSSNLFNWYQQLVAESLGKKGLGILPIVSNMPKDNHSVMQLYLDGFKNNFFTFFYVKEKNSLKINNSQILQMQSYLKNKDIDHIIYAQKQATENVFKNKKIPFRSFEIIKRDENTLGELFTFFILETILLGRALKINPFDQPAVELIKTETKKILI